MSPEDGPGGAGSGDAPIGAGGGPGDSGGSGDGDGAAGDGDGRAGDGVDGGETEPEEGVPTTEKAVMALSFGFTVALFAFALWQAATGAPAPPPSANVTETVRVTEDAAYYVVTLRNDGDAGLLSVTVTVECPTPTRTVTFENVPATGHRNATVRCPPGGPRPSAEVTAWIPE